LALYLEDKHKRTIKEVKKRRYACSHCGKTWIELTGLFVVRRKGVEEVYLRLGVEVDNCQMCKFQPVECPECSSKSVYETDFLELEGGTPYSHRAIGRDARQ
jgi:transposase-like protein